MAAALGREFGSKIIYALALCQGSSAFRNFSPKYTGKHRRSVKRLFIAALFEIGKDFQQRKISINRDLVE